MIFFGLNNPTFGEMLHCLKSWSLVFTIKITPFHLSQMAWPGNYMVRNTPFARDFLMRWAQYYDEKPSGFSSSDNGAIQLVVPWMAKDCWKKITTGHWTMKNMRQENYLYISKFTQSLIVSELWPWILLTKVMETIQVEGFQTCYQMYRNLTDKATWTSQSEDSFESKQHQNVTTFWKSFPQHVHHLHISSPSHFLDFNILNCIFHPSPFFLHRLRSPIWIPIGITCIVQKRSISQMQSCLQRPKNHRRFAEGHWPCTCLENGWWIFDAVAPLGVLCSGWCLLE